jgi:hypothetical protein
MNSELIVLADNGLLYSWNWDTNAAPLSEQHGINLQLFPDGQNTGMHAKDNGVFCDVISVIIYN